ncbi:glycosyltransferase family 4 protein [Rhodopirellula europaea]|nr:glycosyltransferase family 4 protein [Rhodopirellula europaea]
MFRKSFSHAWVAGINQYELACRLGFERQQIQTGLYCADVARFHQAIELRDAANGQLLKSDSAIAEPASGSIDADKKMVAGEHRPTKQKKLLYVGRLVVQKQILEFARLFGDLKPEQRNGWKLVIRGAGDLSTEFVSSEHLDVGGFVQPSELPTLAASADAYVLPSKYEPWGVTIHEFAAAGLPILCSRQCGAATAFVQDGYNGFTFDALDEQAMRSKLLELLSLGDERLTRMGQRSYELSLQNTPELWAAKLLELAMREL